MAEDKKHTCANCGGIIAPGILSGWYHVTPGPLSHAHLAEPKVQ